MRKLLFALLFLSGLGIWLYMNNNQTSISDDSDHFHKVIKSSSNKTTSHLLAQSDQTKEKKVSSKKYKKPKKINEQPQTEDQSLESLTKVLSSFKDSPIDYNPLVEQLKDWQLVPRIAKNSNPHTGEMAIIRTDKTLPGTRYFHAQYFSDEKGESHLQHMSFEFRPGPNAFEKAIKTVSANFGLKDRPQYQKNDFASWNTDNGYIIWIKKMGLSDLEGDPFNAYSKDDVGTIRVAVELEIHEGPGHDESEHLEVSPE